MTDKIKDITIFDYGYDGEGVGKIDNKICFVPYSIIGEQLKIEKISENSNFIRGRIVQFDKTSDLRVLPRCPYFAKCGGCAYQHLNYEEEIFIKKDLFSRQLKKIGYLGDIIVHKSPQDYFYRNKIKLFVKNGTIGLKIRSSNNVIDIDKCLICKNEISEIINKIDLFFKGNKIYDYYDKIEILYKNNIGIIIFYKNRENDVNYQGLIINLQRKINIYEFYDKKIYNVYTNNILNIKNHGLTFEMSPKGFHQVNDDVADDLYNNILNNLYGENILNCYSGGGFLSGLICKQNKKVIAIELGEQEHLEAENLKYQNKLKHLTNLRGDCGKILPNLNLNFDTVIVDPPRSGLDKIVVSSLNKLNYKRLIYVSCDSATLVRDIALLNDFNILNVHLFDMFPRTGEYECMVVLQKK